MPPQWPKAPEPTTGDYEDMRLWNNDGLPPPDTNDVQDAHGGQNDLNRGKPLYGAPKICARDALRSARFAEVGLEAADHEVATRPIRATWFWLQERKNRLGGLIDGIDGELAEMEERRKMLQAQKDSLEAKLRADQEKKGKEGEEGRKAIEVQKKYDEYLDGQGEELDLEVE
ncbi:hypothetical protein TI39_contig491g00015 [Zymoseptoria brevis]|uniref:Uncharacterized protein n=1 Tax=Zymoseptoria brevis TaxID=1047168 RepID=A0A0F4GJ94_9PEZI|nr:hypothetical protein TI39_contig491g00015 [Zymoseptoria brevis]